MQILELYKGIIRSLGLQAGEDGLISTAVDDLPEPVNVEGMRWALPTDALLIAGGFNAGSKLVAFHPICESAVLSKSPVLAQIEMAVNLRLWATTCEIASVLIPLAANPKNHKKLKMKEHGLLTVFKDMKENDERSAKDLLKVFSESTHVGKQRLLSLYVRQAGSVYAGERVARLARFYPTVMESIDETKRSIFGVNLRVADLAMFKGFIEYLFPNYEDEERYASPSNSLVAPTFHALMKCFAKVASQLNDIIDLHAKSFPDPDAVRIPLDWVDAIVDLSVYRDAIPVLPYNDGAAGTKGGKGGETAVSRQTAAPAQQFQPQAPKAKDGEFNVDSFLSALKPQSTGFVARGFNPLQVPVEEVGGFRPVGYRAATARQYGASQNPDDNLPDWALPAEPRSTFGSGFSNRPVGGGTGAL